MDREKEMVFQVEYNIMQSFREYELMLRGHIEPPNYSHNTHLSRADLLQVQRKDLESSFRISRECFGSIFYGLGSVTTQELKSMVRRFEQALSELPTDLNDTIFDLYRSYLQKAVGVLRDEMSDRGVIEAPLQDDVDQMRAHIRKTIETIAKLEQDCEEEVKRHPEQETQIRRIYRQAIDRIREQQ